MKLSLIRMSGFRGVRHDVELRLPTGFTVICGRNGTGKSSVCDAIEFVLTGRLERYLYETEGGDKVTEKGETISDYLWWRGSGRMSGEAEVTLGIIDDDGREHTFTRGRSGLVLGDEADLRRLVFSGTDPSPKALSDVSRTTLFRDEEITRLSVDLPETDRFSFVRSAVGFGGFSPLESKAQKAVGTLRDRASAIQAQYETVRNEVATITSRLSELRSRAAQGDDTASAEAVIRRILSVQSGGADDGALLMRGRLAVTDLHNQLDVLVSALRQLEEITARASEIQTQVFQDELANLNAKARSASEELRVVSDRGRELAAALLEYQRTEPAVASRAQLAEHGARLGLVDEKCPLCGSRVTPESFGAHLEELRRVVESSSSELSRLTREQSDLADSERRLRRELEALQQRTAAASGAAELVEQQRQEVISRARRVLASEAPISVETLGTNIERRRQDLTAVERAISTLEASLSYRQVVEAQRELETMRQRSEELRKQLSRVQAAEERARAMAHAIRRLSGELVDEQVAALSPLLGELYLRLRPHVDWQDLRYRMRGDVRRFLSLEVGEGLNPRFLFSSGQRRAMGIAFLLAVHLSRSWCKLRTLVLDDPVQHVDDFRALHLVEVLSAIRTTGEQVICTVEDPALADLLCRRLRSSDTEQGSLVSMDYEPGEGVKISDVRSIPELPRAILRLA